VISVDGYLQAVQRNLAGMDATIREDILRELRSHLSDSVQANGGDVSVAIANLGDAAAVGRRYRDLYGYGVAYRAVFAVVAGLLAVLTVPVLFVGEAGLFPYLLSAIFLGAVLMFLIWTSLAAGNRAGLLAGGVALVGRVAGLGTAFLVNRDASLVTPEGLTLFVLVSVLFVFVGWIPGKARQAWRRPGAEL